jgi:DNA-binding MarR family transcriptional regulator
MSKKKDRLPPFVAIFKSTIDSEEFKRLTNASRVAYMLLKRQCRHRDQNEVRFPYSDAEAYMDRHTFGRSIEQLEKEGFISKEQEGGLFRRTNIYKILI